MGISSTRRAQEATPEHQRSPADQADAFGERFPGRTTEVKLLGEIYRFHFKNEARERLFLASLGFLVTFGVVRGITYMIRVGVGPFHNVTTGGLHIHHLVWGILILLVVGYLWLIERGVGSNWMATVTAIAYGVGAALTLDEFALWLNLQDVYWERTGRQSVDAVIIFAAGLSVGIWGGPFLRAVVRELVYLFRRRASQDG